MLTKIWTTLCLSAAAVCAVGWFVALMHEHGIRPVCSLVEFFRKQSKAGRIVLAAFFLGLWIYAANKPGDGSGSGGSSGDDAGGTNTEETVGMVLGDAGTNDTMFAAFGLPLSIGGLDGLSLVGSGDMPVTLSMGEEAVSGPVASTNAARQLTDEDFRRGFVLTRTGTGETFDFSAPSNADVCADWRAFGAAEDWAYIKCRMQNDECRIGTNVIDRLRIYSFGKADVLVTNEAGRILTGNWLAPFRASLGIAPEANWNLLDTNASTNSSFITHHSSLFWSSTTPSNTLRLTWQNVLLNRETNSPVSFQAELWPSGKFLYRYDLSRCGGRGATALPDGVVTNIFVGASCGGSAWTTNALATNVTSLAFYPLTAEDEANPDRDGDGIETVDELFVYGTDPDNADTDYDGLSDSDELFVYNTSPLDPHTRSALICDGFAVKIGDVGPFSCPAGSTNTVLEHIFYSGTTNGVFAYPQSSGSSAVLRVSVSGAGSGELVVGSTVVPLIAPTSDAPALASTEGGGGSFGTPLLVQVARGENVRLYLRGDSSLSVALDSDDFAFGTLPSLSGGSVIGFVNFPNTVAETPCIHDFNARRKAISLPVVSGAEALACTWTGSNDVEVENVPPRSAIVTGSFNARATGGVAYTLSHPLYLFGRTIYAQTVRFCPRPSDADPDDSDADDPSWYADGEGDDSGSNSTEREERWCCFWGTCCNDDGTCSCGCDGCCQQDEDCWSEDEEPLETCPLHHVPYEQCASLHYDAYTNATGQVEEYRDMLKIRDPLDYDQIHLPCPSSYRKCCDCPDHCTNYVAVAYKSYRLGLIDENGNAFTRAVDPCTVRVASVHPSSSVGDAALGFVTNGVVFRTYGYTVLGVGFSKPDGPPLSVYNSLSRTMGVPMTVTTNVNHALRLDLLTNVGLPSGDMQFSIDAEEGSQFTVWMYDYGRGRYRRLLDTDGRSVINLPISRWRRLVGRFSESYSRATPIYVTSAAKGSATLRIGYWCIVDGKIVQDWQSQVVTSVDPPLLPDINNDGCIDDSDVSLFLAGRKSRFWCNQETVKGDYVGQEGNDAGNALDLQVNGRYDLVNFFPVSLDLSALKENWGNRVTYRLETDMEDTNTFKCCFARIGKSTLREMQTMDKLTLDGQDLHAATLVDLPPDGIELGSATIESLCQDDAVVVAEAVTPYVAMRVSVKVGDATLYSFTAPFSIRSVRDMYRVLDLTGAVDDSDFVPYVPSADPPNYPDAETDGTHFIFAHGYNVNPYEAMVWHDQMFKRFWWSGSKSMYTGVVWRGDESQFQLPYVGGATPDYYVNVEHALTTARYLAVAVGSLPGTKKFMGAHSLGNMLVSAAIVNHGLRYDRYFMFDAAVALEAYDTAAITAETKTNMTPANWRAYSDRVRASHWFELFDTADARRDLTWHGRFSSLTNAVNYYSSEEDVLDNSDGQTHPVASSSYAWMNQETRKGVWPALLPGNNEAGWEFNSLYKVDNPHGGQGEPLRVPRSPAQADLISTNSLVVAPFFAPFDDMSICVTNRLETVPAKYQLLGDAIPAESYATGRNPVPSWGVVEESCQNVDMIIFKNSSVDQPWLHGFLKDCSFMMIHGLFDDVQEKKGN